MAGRALARGSGALKGIASGMAGFMDFKRSFEDAVRKHQWEKERNAEEDKIKRQTLGVTAGYAPEDMGKFLATGEGGNWRPSAETIEGGKPTWGQRQKIKSIKSGLLSGQVTIGREFGEPSTYQITSLGDAQKAISDAGLDPSIFGEELKRYAPVVVKDKRGRLFELPSFQLDEALKQGYVKVE